MNPLEPKLNERLKDVPDYVPGAGVAQIAMRYGMEPYEIVKCASNENPLGTSPLAKQALADAVSSVHVYPEGQSEPLVKGVCAKHGIKPSQVIFGNGSDEILEFIMGLFVQSGDEVIMPYPTFQMYPLLCRITRATMVKVPLKDDYSVNLEAMVESIGPKTRVVIVCNPNNPTGGYIDQQGIRKFLSCVPEDVIVILDEAYAEYVDGYNEAFVPEMLKAYSNVIFCRTFSKIYGLAGLRLGYGVANEWLVRNMQKIRPPFNANLLAQIAACAALKDEEFLTRSFETNMAGRKFLYEELDKLGVFYIPTQSNFICVKVPQPQKAYEAFIRGGIIVRALHSFGMDDFVRFTIGLEAENKKFIAVVKQLKG